MGRRYTSEQIAFLRSAWPVLTLRELTEEFNRRYRTHKPIGAIKSVLTNNKIKNNRKPGVVMKGKSHAYSDAMLKFLRDHYPLLTGPALTKAFNQQFHKNKTQAALTATCKRFNIQSGRTGHYRKGHKPWNTGTKGLMKPNAGTFKKGHTPKNKKPIGHERICKKDGYILIRVAGINPHTGHDGYYRMKHHVIWEQAHGPVPAGMVLRFKDENKLNCTLDNLELVSKSEHLHLNKNGYSQVPAVMKPTVKAVTRLSIAAADKKRKSQEAA